ncbi:g6072 [Coccomyxa viridis]|uniref:G6072 protein n=1 Tax=Coccomyxa viridis TaxID=1274662 RepID=A0ABP1FUG5_9CHLO
MPARKCQRLVRRLRECGRGLEELQVEREEVIESNFRGDVNNVDNLDRIFGTPSTSGQPLDASVGEAIEDFMQFAEGLKHQTVQGDCRRDEAPQRRLRGHPGNMDDPQGKRRGFLSRMLAREAECSPGRRRQQQHTWQEYARDFREVCSLSCYAPNTFTAES